MKPRQACALLLLCCLAGAAANAAAPVYLAADSAPSPLSVQPDRADWTYGPGQSAQVRIRIAREPYPAAGIPIRYRLGPDMREGREVAAMVPAAGLVLDVPAPAAPGFVRAIVDAELDGKKHRAVATLGFNPGAIVATQLDPEDFNSFWDRQKADLAAVAPDYVLTPAPALSNEQVEVSYLSFQNVGAWPGPSRFYGVLAVPRGAGPFPALLELPGAGVRMYKGARKMAEQGMITLQMGIHGVPLDLPLAVYEGLNRGALLDYNRFQLDDRERYYYRRVYLGAMRASDYLASHPKWNGKQLIASGGSQGGQLAIMTAAMDKRVTALVASYPAYSDVSGYLHGSTGGWPGLFRSGADGSVADQPVAPKLATTRYYDTVNFARRLRVPGLYSWGYNDQVTPPTSTFAAYNVIGAPKSLQIAPGQAHTASAAQQSSIEAWILRQAGLKPPEDAKPKSGGAL
ncbi:MAG: acetylxylan esterase [Pseudomonadota bacterium]